MSLLIARSPAFNLIRCCLILAEVGFGVVWLIFEPDGYAAGMAFAVVVFVKRGRAGHGTRDNVHALIFEKRPVLTGRAIDVESPMFKFGHKMSAALFGCKACWPNNQNAPRTSHLNYTGCSLFRRASRQCDIK